MSNTLQEVCYSPTCSRAQAFPRPWMIKLQSGHKKGGHPWHIQTKHSHVRIAAQALPLALLSRSSLLPRASPMSPGVVPTAGQSKNKSAVAGMAAEAEATDSRGKCTLQYAPLAARTPRSPSSPETGARCTALTATLNRGGRDKGSS